LPECHSRGDSAWPYEALSPYLNRRTFHWEASSLEN
jgi:hypothetical protein